MSRQKTSRLTFWNLEIQTQSPQGCGCAQIPQLCGIYEASVFKKHRPGRALVKPSLWDSMRLYEMTFAHNPSM